MERGATVAFDGLGEELVGRSWMCLYCYFFGVGACPEVVERNGVGISLKMLLSASALNTTIFARLRLVNTLANSMLLVVRAMKSLLVLNSLRCRCRPS